MAEPVIEVESQLFGFTCDFISPPIGLRQLAVSVFGDLDFDGVRTGESEVCVDTWGEKKILVFRSQRG